MSLTVDGKGAGSFEICPEGVTQGVCYAMYELGTHLNEMYGKEQRKILICWELPELLMEDGRPFAVSKTYNASIYEGSNLRNDLESWRGKKFTQEELEGFNTGKLVGANCQLNIVHNTKGEKTYANIKSIMPITKSMSQYKPTNPTVVYEMKDSEIPDIPEVTPKWIADKIKSSKEWEFKELHDNASADPGPPPDEETIPEPF